MNMDLNSDLIIGSVMFRKLVHEISIYELVYNKWTHGEKSSSRCTFHNKKESFQRPPEFNYRIKVNAESEHTCHLSPRGWPPIAKRWTTIPHLTVNEFSTNLCDRDTHPRSPNCPIDPISTGRRHQTDQNGVRTHKCEANSHISLTVCFLGPLAIAIADSKSQANNLQWPLFGLNVRTYGRTFTFPYIYATGSRGRQNRKNCAQTPAVYRVETLDPKTDDDWFVLWTRTSCVIMCKCA